MGAFDKIVKYKWLGQVILNTPFKEKKRLYKSFKNRKQYYTSPFEDFQVNLKEMAKCALCPNMCRFDCPAVLVDKHESHSPANKARIGLFMGMGRIPMDTNSAIDALYACMNCNACQHWCPMDISTGDLMIQMRAELEKRDLLPKKFDSLKENIKNTDTIFDEKPFSKDSEFNINDDDPEIFYYIGCMSAKYQKEMVKANIALFKHLGKKITTAFDDRVCCGSPLNKVGLKSSVSSLIPKNIETITKSGASLIVTDCPACAAMLEKTYSDLGFALKIPILHTSTFFLNEMKKNNLRPTRKIEKRISYHDPCVLVRDYYKADEIRELFNMIPGLDLREAFLNKEETRCCGYGGGYHVSNPKYSELVGDDRFNQLTTNNQEIVVSACPTCEYSLQEAKNRKNEKMNVEIKDFAELLAESLDLI